MAGRKKTETVEAEVVETAVVPAGKMEFRLINPTEDGFLRRIQWNKEELEAAVRAKIAGYENVVYTEENIKAAKNDRAELNKLIKATMVKEFIPNYDPNIKGESREISKPQFKHKVTSAVKITDEKGGNLNNEMEMVMDEETGCYVLQPIANTQQRTIFDSDFMQGQKQEGEGNEDIIDGTYIDADVRPALPGPADEEKPAETEKTDTQPAEETPSEENNGEPGDTPAEEPNEEEPEDITDDILGDADTEGYDYEDPEE